MSQDEQPVMGGQALAPGVVVPSGAVRWAFSRSAGPGGQNVNKLATKAELRIAIEDLPISGRAKGRLRAAAGRRVIGAETVVDEDGRSRERGGELVLTSESQRSQGRNKDECLEKLRELLVGAMAEPKVRRKTKPSKSSKARRLEGKKRRGEIKRGRAGGDGE
jgi:ribosome-associated protein